MVVDPNDDAIDGHPYVDGRRRDSVEIDVGDHLASGENQVIKFAWLNENLGQLGQSVT